MAPIGANTPIHIGMIDHSGEKSGTLLYFQPLEDDGSNFDTLVTPVTGDYDLIKGPLTAITIMNMTRSIASFVIEQDTATLPSNAHAQREVKILFTYLDEDTNALYSFTVPGPTTTVIPSGTDEIDLDNVLIAAFVAAVEAKCVSPVGGPITVMSARLVGRNS